MGTPSAEGGPNSTTIGTTCVLPTLQLGLGLLRLRLRLLLLLLPQLLLPQQLLPQQLLYCSLY